MNLIPGRFLASERNQFAPPLASLLIEHASKQLDKF